MIAATQKPSLEFSSSFALAQWIQQALDEKKATDIICLDLEGKTLIADYFIIASGTSNRHLLSMAQFLKEHMKKQGRIASIEGQEDWILVDSGDIMIHLFRPEIRAHYNLEEIWQF